VLASARLLGDGGLSEIQQAMTTREIKVRKGEKVRDAWEGSGFFSVKTLKFIGAG
jgi:hypothetical protein